LGVQLLVTQALLLLALLLQDMAPLRDHVTALP
jgi:hypothetical protein